MGQFLKQNIKVTFAPLLVLLCLVLPIRTDATAATSGICGENLTWKLENNVLTIEGSGSMTDYTSGEAPWYDSAFQIKTVRLPQGLTSIGSYAFQSCGFGYLNIPSNVSSIGEYAFYSSALSSAVLPASLTRISPYAFAFTGLRSINLPDGVTSIPDSAFYACFNLTDVTLPQKLVAIGDSAFESCTKLTNLIIPDTVRNIGRYAFSECSVLENVNLPEGITSIADNVFDGCTGLKTVVLPQSVMHIGYSAFSDCTSLESINLPPQLTTINDGAFSGCTNIKMLDLPVSLSSVGTGVFYGCTSLNSLIFPSGLTSIGDTMCSGCTSLTSIKIPESVSVIGYYAFSDCTSLTKVTIPEGVAELGGSAFRNCISLQEIVLPKSIKFTGGYFFKNCTALTDVYYGGSEAEWTALFASYPYDVMDESVTIHYNWVVVEEPVLQPDVRYYSSWNPEKQLVYFSMNDTVGCAVTAETGIAFTSNPGALLNSYVQVETKSVDGREVLVSMKPVVTEVGTVTAADASQITFKVNTTRTVTYALPADLTNPTDMIGKQAVFHVLDGKLLALEALQSREGYLTHVNAGSKLIKVEAVGNESDYQYYDYSSPLAAGTNILGIETGSRNQRVLLMVDRNNILYQIEKTGFSAQDDGWCIVNNSKTFYYDEKYRTPHERYEKVFGKSYIAAAEAAKIKDYNSMIPIWGGNCFGLSLTSVLFYLDMLDWQDWNTYNGIEFEDVNDYYTNRRYLDYGLFNYVALAKDAPVSELIECYQILYCGDKEGYTKEDSSFWNLGNFMTDGETYIQSGISQNFYHIRGGDYIGKVLNRIQCSDEPLILCFWTGKTDDNGKHSDVGHAVVTRTDKKPEITKEGWYRVYIYDPNTPYLSAADKIVEEYGGGIVLDTYLNDLPEDSFIELHPDKNQWRYYGSTNSANPSDYWGSDEEGNQKHYLFDKNGATYTLPDILYVVSLSGSGIPLEFNGTEPWMNYWDDKVEIRYTGDANMSFSDMNGAIICDTVKGVPVTFTDDIELSPANGMLSGADRIVLPYTEFHLEYSDGDDISILGNGTVVNIASTGNIKLDVSMLDAEITITGNEDADITVQITDVYSNSEYTSVSADGSLKAGDTMVMKMKDGALETRIVGDGEMNLYTDNSDAPEVRVIRRVSASRPSVSIADVRQAEHEHTYREPAFTWNDDNTCTATFACLEDDDTQTVSCRITSETTEPGETEDGQTVHTASVTFSGKTYTDIRTVVIPATGHISHTAGEKWHADNSTHWKSCRICGAETDRAEHIPGAEATECASQKCSICGYVLQMPMGLDWFFEHQENPDSYLWASGYYTKIMERYGVSK